ncbi:MAG: putative dsRNA-binding protein [Methanoregula sp.]|nr:putative dsRNA-binding protein [Methanoregula sp.]
MEPSHTRTLPQILEDPVLSLPEIIREFIRCILDAANLPGDSWQVSKEEWQRYEFLGDRVLNLIVAEYLFSREPPCREGEMTKKMGVVSNESLTGIAERCGIDVSCLVPQAIGRQQTYGDAVKGGAVEACIGAMYAHAGFAATRVFVLRLMAGETDRYDPSENFIGRLQEQFQHRGLLVPVYREISRAGPPHQPRFTFGVYDAGGKILGTGSGPDTTGARQQAAKQALLAPFPGNTDAPFQT